MSDNRRKISIRGSVGSRTLLFLMRMICCKCWKASFNSIFIFLFFVGCTPSDITVEQYHGKYSDMKHDDFEVFNAGRLCHSSFVPKDKYNNTLILLGKRNNQKFDYIYALVDSFCFGEDGCIYNPEPYHALVIKLNDEYDVFDTSDTNCKIDDNNFEEVIAIGKWKWRDYPSVGGYAYAINKAWFVNCNTMRFEETFPGRVKCEINEDRN